MSRSSVLSGPDAGSVLRSSTLSLGGAAVSALVNIGLIVYLARNVPQDLLGAFATGQSWFLVLVVLAELGTTTGLVLFLSRARVNDDIHQLRRYLLISLGPVAVATAVATATLWLAAPTVLADIASTSPEAVTSLRLLSLMLPLAVVTEVVNSASLGLGKVLPTIIIDRFARPVLQAALVILAVVAAQPAWASGLWGLAFLPLAVAAVVWFLTISSRMAPDWYRPTSHEKPRGFWRYTAPRAATSVIQVLLQRLDIILVAAIGGAVPAAIYVAATRFVVIAQVGNQALSTVLQPRIAEAVSADDHPRVASLYQVSTGWLVLLTWPVLMMAWHFAPQVMEVFGSDYESGAQAIRVLAVAMLFATGVGLVDVVLLMSGGSALALGNHLAALGTMIALDIWLIPSIGVTGAALGWGAALAVKNLLPLLQVARRLHVSPLARSSLIAYGISAVAFGLAPAVVVAVLGASVTTAILALVGGTVLLSLGALRFRVALGLDGWHAGAAS